MDFYNSYHLSALGWICSSIVQQSRVGIRKIIEHFRPKSIQEHLGARVANLGLDSVKYIDLTTWLPAWHTTHDSTWEILIPANIETYSFYFTTICSTYCPWIQKRLCVQLVKINLTVFRCITIAGLVSLRKGLWTNFEERADFNNRNCSPSPLWWGESCIAH